MTLRTKLELQCKETEESVKTGEANLVKNKIELEELTLKIAEAKEKLQKQVQPKFEEALAPFVSALDLTPALTSLAERLQPIEAELSTEMDRVNTSYQGFINSVPA